MSRDFRSVPPPANLNVRSSYSSHEDVHSMGHQARTHFEQKLSSSSSFTRKPKFGDFEDEYFEHEDDDLPPVKPIHEKPDDDEEDPLEAFMAELNKSEQKDKFKTKPTKSLPSSSNSSKEKKPFKGIRQDIEDEDLEESYYKYMESNPNAGVGTFAGGSDDETDAGNNQIEYDDDGIPIPNKKMIDPLPMVYHSQIDYPSFEKNFYEEHEDIQKLTSAECNELRKKLGLRVSGPWPPKPCSSFAHFNFDENLMKMIRKLEFSRPTPIQAQAIPAILSGRDVIGIAKTGSGKTASFVWPLLFHILDQPALKAGDGPIGLILVPTRELSQQIYQEAKKFAKPYNIRVLCAYGGGNKFEQSKDLEQGADIVVATPGRLIDFVKMKATNLLRVTYLVLDEADRMFDMGFEPQVRSICNHVRPDRQTLMFSATFKRKIEKLARDVLTDPVRIVQGDGVGEANEDITQIVHVFKSQTSQKWDWLMDNLVLMTSSGSVLIFVTKKANAQELCKNLEEKTNFHPLLLHGDMNQFDRNKIITTFKRQQESNILVATDVAARGLDISHIRTVINYDMALDIDTHTHRIGRTGRAGQQGIAYTLVTERDKEMVGHLVRNLESANQPVPEELMNLAMQSQWFKKSRFKSGGRPGESNKPLKLGLGFKRPESQHGTSENNPKVRQELGSSFVPSSSNSSPSIVQPESSKLSDRLSLMRQAYKSQFGHRFVAASSDTAWNKPRDQTHDQSKSNKKSRWQ